MIQKITIRELLNSVGGLNELMQMDLPGVMSFRVAVIGKNVDKLLQAYNETQQKLLAPYKNGEDGKLNIPEDKQEETDAQINALLEEEVELDIPKKVSVTSLEGLEIKPVVIASVSYLFVDDEKGGF